MAASRKKPVVRKPPVNKPGVRRPPIITDSEAEISARMRELESRDTGRKDEDDEDEDEDDDDEEEDEGPRLAFYDPAMHTVLAHETFRTLVQSKVLTDQSAMRQAEADSKRVESFTMGFSANTNFLQQQLQKAHEFGDEQRRIADTYRDQYIGTERKLSEMIRQSEEARLERERLAAEISRGKMSLERVERELDNKARMRQAELDAISAASAPLFAAVGQGAMQLMAGLGPKLAGVAPTMGPAGSKVPAPGQTSDGKRIVVSGADIEAWSQSFLVVMQSMGLETMACVRAAIASAVIPNAPPFPEPVKNRLLQGITNEADQQVLQQLMMSCAQQAYMVEDVARDDSQRAAN